MTTMEIYRTLSNEDVVRERRETWSCGKPDRACLCACPFVVTDALPRSQAMREVYPTKYYRDEGFVEYKVEIKDEDLEEIIEEYLARHADFEFDELAIVNNRPFNIWVYATCRRYVDPDDPEGVVDAEVEVRGEYDGNPTGA